MNTALLASTLWAAPVSTLLVAMTVTGEASAQTSEATSGKLEEVVVSSRRREERLEDVPVAVSAISAAALERYAVADVTSVTQMVPSMVVGRQVTGSSASIFLRGVGSTSLSSGFDQSVSLNLDGIAMSRGREIVSSLYDVSQIEVLKGPQALFFGKNSTGGVISVTTRLPTRQFEGSVKLGYEADADERFVEGVVSGPLTEQLGARLAVRAARMDGYFDNPAQANVTNGFLRVPNSDRRPESENISARVTLQYEPADTGWMFILRAAGTQLDDSGAGDHYERLCAAGRTTPRATSGIAEPYADCFINGRNSTANVPPVIAAAMPDGRDGQTYTDHTSYSTSLTAEYSADTWLLSSVTGAYGFKQADLNSFSGATAGIYATQSADFDQISQELRLLTDFDGPLNAMVGVYLADAKFRFDTSAFAAILPVDPATGRYHSFGRANGFDGTTQSAFVELTWAISGQLELAGGVRWTQEEKDSFANATYVHPLLLGSFAYKNFSDQFKDDNLSPQLTLTWHATDDLMFYGAYKEGFKSGGYNTSITILRSVNEADGKFGSETAQGFELGTKSTFLDGTLRLSATLYDYDYDDLQVQVFDAATTASRVDNAGTLNTRGVEVEIDWLIPKIDGLRLRSAVSYNEATYEDYIGSCFTGQTVAEGCNLTPGATGAFNNQDFDGRTPPKAPRFAGQVGLTYERPVVAGLLATVSTDAAYSDDYNFTDTLRPDGVQDSFVRYDLSVGLADENKVWEVALIGRNLSNELVVSSANDMPAQGAGGTGTAVGVRSDMNAVVERGRQYIVQGTWRF